MHEGTGWLAPKTAALAFAIPTTSGDPQQLGMIKTTQSSLAFLATKQVGPAARI
jgi:hypothetical protein